MKKTSRTIALLLVIVLLISVVTGCSKENTATGGEKKKVAFIPQLIGIPYFTAMEEGGKKAADEFGMEFIYSGSVEVSAPEQSKIMDSLIRQKVDAICVSVLDSSSINPMIKKAKEAGLHPFTSDSDSPSSEREVYVAQAMDKDLGYTLIDRLAEQLGGKGEIGIVSGDSTATNLNTWIEYMEERLEEKYPDINVLDIRYATTSEESLRQAQELMTKNPNISGLIAVASVNIPGVAQAVEQAGKAGKVAVIGYGSPQTVKPYMESGVMKESILWNAFDLGYLTVWAGLQLIEGNEFKEENTVPGLKDVIKYYPEDKILLLGPPLVINQSNVNDFNF